MEGETVRESPVETTATESQAQGGGYYALRVDARGVPLADTLYDTAEKLVAGELDNARQALDHLWTMRKGTQTEAGAATVDGLIAHYDTKMQMLRTRQETLRRVSEGARKLLDQKQHDENRLGRVKDDIADMDRAIREYTERREKLRAEECELLAGAERRLGELASNEKTVVGALRDVILARQTTASEQKKGAKASDEDGGTVALNRGEVEADGGHAPAAQKARQHRTTPRHAGEGQAAGAGASARHPGQSEFARSVVKTSTGRVLGEYHYDATVERGRRHYILNSRFLLEQLSRGVEALRAAYDRDNHAELVQMLQDAHARISQSPNLHYETSTQDVVNHESVLEAWQQLRMKAYDEVGRFCEALRDKLDILGTGYRRQLQAQMDTLLGRTAERG